MRIIDCCIICNYVATFERAIRFVMTTNASFELGIVLSLSSVERCNSLLN